MNLLARLRPQNSDQRLFMAFIGLLMVAGILAALLNSVGWLAVPVVVLGVAVVLVDWRWVYYLLLLTLAFSREFPLPGGLSMDIPSEPLMLVLLVCIVVSVLLGREEIPRQLWVHPLVVIMGLALLWSVISSLFSVSGVKSLKYLLAKTWYIGPFVFGTLAIVRRPRDVWRLVGFFAAGVVVTIFYTMKRHAALSFGFDSINKAIQPFYINHVIYATTAALLVPYAYFAGRDAATRRGRWLWYGCLTVLVAGVILSYTRASMLALVVAGLFYVVIRLHLMRLVLLGAAVAALSGAFYFMNENNYMLYAPDFEKTIFNGKNFEKHLEATYKLQDVSGMERVYRWVAAARMIADKPLTGSGPATFYPEYKRYTVKSFRTYVSNNPEKSTTHNYFLLQLAEQGIPGFVLFAALISSALIMVERIYHRSRSVVHRHVVMAAGLCLVIIIFHLLLNELVEVDKIGSFFYISLAVLMRAGMWIRAEPQPEPSEAE